MARSDAHPMQPALRLVRATGLIKKDNALASDARQDMQDTSSAWPMLIDRLGGERRLIAAFAICSPALVWLGLSLKTNVGQLTLIWPGVGLLLAVLILAPMRRWPVLLAIQLASEYLVAWALREPSVPDGGIFLFMLANTSDALLGALLARSHLWRNNAVRISLALQFLLASAAGAALGATLGAAVAVFSYGAASYWEQWQLWWAGNWLGSLVIAPPVLFWAIPVRHVYAPLQLLRRWEIPVLGVVLVACTWLLFREPIDQARSLLQTPALALGVLLVIAFRLPPRWSSLLVMAAVLTATTLGAAFPQNMIGDAPISRMLVLQTYLIVMAALPLIVGMLVTSMRVALHQVSASEARYRTFIELSSEAIWRVEVDPPMPITLPPDAQRQWLRVHACVAESNAAFDRFNAACTEPVDHGPTWVSARSWCALYEKHLQSAADGYSADGLRLIVNIEGRDRTFMTAFNGVVVEGRLRRIWCVGRDVSEITDLNTRLLRERERLKAYAHQLVNAEERARRATAVELHDGIGQSLTGMAMSLEVARMQAPQVAQLLDDVRQNLRHVQERTRNMIADLNPPGLYDLGLTPALQWLVVHFRGQNKLRVQLECAVREEAISMELRVLVFKLVRELLRNVVKHSGVDVARVRVLGDHSKLHVEVTDAGRGFEWQMEMFGPSPGAFGLWSISDRVADFGGEFSVDTSPGEGARFRLDIPLSR